MNICHTHCRREDLAAWIFRSLEEPQAREVAHHCAQCPECAAEALRLRNLVDYMRKQPNPVCSPGLTDRILKALPDEEERNSRRPRLASVALAAAAALIVLLGLFLMFSMPPARSSRTTAAVASPRAPIDWLVAHQEADGSWLPSRMGGNDAYRPALTALIAMALREQAASRHADSLARALTALVSMQQPDGSFGSHQGARLYNHAIATCALLGPSRPEDRPAIERAIAYSRQAQLSDGGWDYTPDGRGNTALTAWQITLLTEAQQQGWEDRQGHLRRGLSWLRGRQNRGSIGYRQPGVPYPGRDNTTLAAMYATTLFKAAHAYPTLTSASREAMLIARRHVAQDSQPSPDYYRDYFLVQALRQDGDREAARHIAQSVANRRQPLGTDTPPWTANDPWRKAGGDFYATAMALLTGV